MANTITYTASIKCEPESGTHGKLPLFGAAATASQATKGVSCPQLVTTTTPAAITFPGLTQVRWIRIQNIDLTNNIQIGPYDTATFYPLAELLPGESMVFPLKATVSLYAKATAGTPALEAQGCET